MRSQASTEADLPVADLLRWMTRADPDQLRVLLIGCALDDGTSDDLLPIADVAIADRVVVLAGGRRISLRTVPQGAIVDRRPGFPLLTAYADSRTPAEQQEAAERADLRQRGVDPDRLGSPDDRRIVLTFLRAQEQGAEISEPALDAFSEAMKRSADIPLYRRAATAVRLLAESSARRGARTPVTLTWRLAWFLTHSGAHEAAIALSETPEARRLPGMHRAYMAGIRASALIALGRMRHDSGLLDQAEQSIRTALAAGSEKDVVNTLYGTLRAARLQIAPP